MLGVIVLMIKGPHRKHLDLWEVGGMLLQEKVDF